MQDFFLVTCIAVLALMGHGAVKVKAFRWIVRIVIICTILFELGATAVSDNSSPFAQSVLIGMVIATAIDLFLHGRKLYSGLLTCVDGIVSLRVLTGPIRHKMAPLKALVDKTIFIPTSYPHIVGLFVYITALGFMLQNISPAAMDFPSIPIPIPVSIQQLFSYNGIGLVMLSFCGVGIFVSRDWKAAFKRLGWEKPTLKHVGIGLLLVAFSFCYDLVWSLLTHAAPGQDMATKLSGYNSGTFASGADLSASIFLALATAICAGVGEETLTRGALQPALGIVPAAILHGVLHAQFAHAPILIIQIAIWSICFGLVRRFTNTTTTIIGHAGFNFVTTFLFAFNP
ncbi:MAG: CPBP family intramembrane glutamic endopeptidase [Candidatus Melainabacteria bacterium]|nr:CPBP family intramembrane glutamic endopeptidase [Candidatus Melainabacteria bacterium]